MQLSYLDSGQHQTSIRASQVYSTVLQMLSWSTPISAQGLAEARGTSFINRWHYQSDRFLLH